MKEWALQKLAMKDEWYDRLWQIFIPDGGINPVCLLCYGGDPIAIHEFVPRSQRPRDWQEPDNRGPLCGPCHREVHESRVAAMAETLQRRRTEYLAMIGKEDDFNALQREYEMGTSS